MEEPCSSQEKGEYEDEADKSWQGGLRGQIAIFFKAADKFIIGIKLSENRWAIRFLHLRPTEASWVGLGFDRSFDDSHFTTTITILAAVDLVLGHKHGLGDPESLAGQCSLPATVVD